MRHSWASMLRTVRAAVAVMLLGGLGLTVPPQTGDMLAFLDDNLVWPAVSFQLALVVLAGLAWFWSRAALAARFGIDDRQRCDPANPNFDWTAFLWLLRLMLFVSFLTGAVIALRSWSLWNIAGAIGLGPLGLVVLTVRPRGPPVTLPPALRYGICAWVRHGARERLNALLRRAPFGMVPAVILLAAGLIPLVLGVIEAFTFALRLPNRLAAYFLARASPCFCSA
jgi:hypothetical protein